MALISFENRPEPVYVEWPATIPFSPFIPHRDMASSSGGRSFSGSEQIIIGTGGFWQISLAAWYRTYAQEEAWQAVMAQLSGRAGVLEIPLCGNSRSPRALATPGHFAADGEGTLFSNGQPFSNGQKWSGKRRLRVRAVTEAPLGGYQYSLTIESPYIISKGMWFTHTALRLGRKWAYRVRNAKRETNGTWTVSVQGVFAATIATSDPLDFDYPVLPMRLASDSDGEPKWNEGAKRWDLSLRLEEAK